MAEVLSHDNSDRYRRRSLRAGWSEVTRVFGYRTPAMRWMLPIMFPVFGVLAIVIVIAALVNGDPPLGFAVLWSLALAWSSYWFLWQFGHSIEVTGTRVVWQAVLRRREVELATLTGNGSIWMGFERLKVRGGPSLMMLTNDRSWIRFLEALNSVHPDQPFRPTRANRLAGRWPLSGLMTGFYERST